MPTVSVKQPRAFLSVSNITTFGSLFVNESKFHFRSPCSTFLVSCSTDNTAIVFDTAKDKKVKILGEHKGWVNGVAWDPNDQYIATIASDRYTITI